MTPRERVLTILEGGQPDEKPIVIWPHEGMQSDIAIVPLERIANPASKARILLAEVLSPFSRSLAKSGALNHVMQQNPSQGEALLRELIRQTKSEIDSAKTKGADGIFYRLQGAEPMYCTPMQYGGHYLEADRELLSAVWKSAITLLYVEGEEETYLDFVSDLPATIFAWDAEKTGFSIEAMRKLRQGALATTSPDADLLFGGNYGMLRQWVKPGGVAASA